MESGNLTDVVQSDFGLTINRSHKIEGGTVNEAYVVETSKGDAIVRIAKERNSFPFEIWAYTRFKAIGIPCPEVIAYQERPSGIGFPTMILEKISGNPLKDVELSPEKEDLSYEEMGAILRKIHSITVEGYGYFQFNEGVARGKDSSWGQYLESSGARGNLHHLLENGFISPSEFEILLGNYEALVVLPVSKPVFVYNDFHSVHVFTDGDEITGIIDPGNAIAGDPRYDIAMSLYFQNDRQQESFKNGYGVLANDPEVDKYLLFIAAQKVALRHKAGRDNVAKGADRLKELLSPGRLFR